MSSCKVRTCTKLVYTSVNAIYAAIFIRLVLQPTLIWGFYETLYNDHRFCIRARIHRVECNFCRRLENSDYITLGLHARTRDVTFTRDKHSTNSECLCIKVTGLDPMSELIKFQSTAVLVMLKLSYKIRCIFLSAVIYKFINSKLQTII